MKKFKLVFLAENEEYLKDFGCSVDVKSTAATGPVLEKLVNIGGLRGRVRLGSQFLYLDLENVADFIRVPVTAVSDVATVGPDCVVIRAGQIGSIPVTLLNGKTRVLKPNSVASAEFELALTLHPTHVPEVTHIIGSLFKHRRDKEATNAFVASFLNTLDGAFDLTSLSSHRETLLLPKAMKVARVKKMIEIFGLLQVTKQYIYFQPMAAFGPRRVKRFPLPAAGSHNMKFKLKNTCVEFSFLNAKNLLIEFQTRADRDMFLSCLSSTAVPALDPSIDTVTELWRTWKISNFDYLMYLNFSAGRSVNDIGQYPIFPWTVKDMTSSVLDLAAKGTYRDLSVPIAATNKARLEQNRERALHMPASERFLFGSFYSNPAFVIYFLIRKFPECHLRLHGGHYDHVARLFTSLRTAWEAVADTGSATMELIPEFYSEFDNANAWLESSPAMTQIPSVTLPTWASSSTDFVIKMRCALESAEVSKSLHKWIDLVFGVKSRGKQICFDNSNLFHPVCYLTDVDGDVQSYCKEVDTTKDIVLLQSQEFGHVPKQLFATDSHPARDMNMLNPEWSSEAYYRNGGGRKPWRQAILEAAPVSRVDISNQTAVAKEEEKISLPTQSVAGNKGSGIQIDRCSLALTCKLSHFVTMNGETIGATNTGYIITSSRKWRISQNAITCMSISGDAKIFAADSKSGDVFSVSPTNGLLRSARVSQGPALCIGILDDELGVSGSADHSISVWRCRDLHVVRLLDCHSSPVTAVTSAPYGSKQFISGDQGGVVACWDLEREVSRPIWVSSPTGSSVTAVTHRGNTAGVVESSGSLTIWHVSTGSIMWKHTPSSGKIISCVFPIPADDSIIFALVCLSSSSSVHAFKISNGAGGAQLATKGELHDLPTIQCVSSNTAKDILFLTGDGKEIVRVFSKSS